jgi:hypothetical protein
MKVYALTQADSVIAVCSSVQAAKDFAAKEEPYKAILWVGDGETWYTEGYYWLIQPFELFNGTEVIE